jgi:hypothetical protein
MDAEQLNTSSKFPQVVNESSKASDELARRLLSNRGWSNGRASSNSSGYSADVKRRVSNFFTRVKFCPGRDVSTTAASHG